MLEVFHWWDVDGGLVVLILLDLWSCQVVPDRHDLVHLLLSVLVCGVLRDQAEPCAHNWIMPLLRGLPIFYFDVSRDQTELGVRALLPLVGRDEVRKGGLSDRFGIAR